MVIDGKVRSFHRRRYCLSCSPFGAHNTGRLAEGETIEDRRLRRQNERRETSRRLSPRRSARPSGAKLRRYAPSLTKAVAAPSAATIAAWRRWSSTTWTPRRRASPSPQGTVINGRRLRPSSKSAACSAPTATARPKIKPPSNGRARARRSAPSRSSASRSGGEKSR